MKVILAIIAGFLIAALLFWEILRQLIAGKVLGRDRFVYATRERNPMLYWSSIALQILTALFVFCVVLLVVLRAKS